MRIRPGALGSYPCKRCVLKPRVVSTWSGPQMSRSFGSAKGATEPRPVVSRISFDEHPPKTLKQRH